MRGGLKMYPQAETRGVWVAATAGSGVLALLGVAWPSRTRDETRVFQSCGRVERWVARTALIGQWPPATNQPPSLVREPSKRGETEPAPSRSAAKDTTWDG